MGQNEKIRSIMNERFHKDSLIALATVDGGMPCVRAVNAYYDDGAFYVVTHAKSGKMRQIAENSAVAICGDWFTAQGIGENLGYVLAPEHTERMRTLRAAFASWYDNGHTNEADPNTCILRIRLTHGVLTANGTRYAIDFSAL